MQALWLVFVVSLLITLCIGPLLLPVLHKMKFGQHIRADGPASHLQKAGTPTMGGVLFLIGMSVTILCFAQGSRDSIVILLVTLGFGFIGFLDDYIKVVLKRSLGLRAREKLLAQVLLAVGLTYWVVYFSDRGTGIQVPFSYMLVPGGLSIELVWWLFLIFTVLFVVGMANAVNLTDGLDGLAAGVSFFVALGMMVVALIAGSSGAALSMVALAGGCLGFLYYNRYPARLFMGDTGSLALGGGLAAAAVITGSELYLCVIGGIFIIETLSVILQVLSFQIRGKRIFRMSPLHHHFELGGWSENKVVVVFLIVTVFLALAGTHGFYYMAG